MQLPANVLEISPLPRSSVSIKMRAPVYLHGLATAVTVYTDIVKFLYGSRIMLRLRLHQNDATFSCLGPQHCVASNFKISLYASYMVNFVFWESCNARYDTPIFRYFFLQKNEHRGGLLYDPAKNTLLMKAVIEKSSKA
jgi:hypothetical protein